MAPKKNVAPPATDAATTSTPAPAKKPAAPRPKKEKPAASTDADAKPQQQQRNMSAVSGEFVASVHKLIPEDLAAKLKVKEVKELCEAFVKTLVSSVLDGKNINFTNNMSFARRLRGARVYKNLKTQESIAKPKHYVMTMTVKPSLKKQFDAVEVSEA